MKLFCYNVNDVDFMVVGQPIVDNATKKISSVEILSRPVSISKKINIDSYFSELSDDDITLIASIQITMIPVISRGGGTLPVNINVRYKTLINDIFISLVSKIKTSKLIFEVNGFEYDNSLLIELKDVFYKLQSLGHEIWLDDYPANNATASLLSALPWNGVKIDKGLFWKSSHINLFEHVKLCKGIVGDVVVEGVEDEFLFNLSIKSSANYSQGFHWKFVSLDDILIN